MKGISDVFIDYIWMFGIIVKEIEFIVFIKVIVKFFFVEEIENNWMVKVLFYDVFIFILKEYILMKDGIRNSLNS